MATLAICPSRGRPDKARECLTSFLQTRRDPNTRIVFAVDDDDPTRGDYPAEYTKIVPASGSMSGALNAIAHDKEFLADATSCGMIGDDNLFRTPGWDLAIDGWLAEHPGIAYVDDGFQHEKLSTCWWVSRPLVDVFGMTPPEFRHFYMDNWWMEVGRAAGCLKYLGDVLIEHMHPLAGKGALDATYERGGNQANVRNDRGFFHRWERRGKVADVAKVKAIISRGQKRRVLADWHHPALWESLSILFEDRFGWELYSMTGLDWTQHGWTFETKDTIGWTPSDYLVFDDAKLVNDHWERREREYPQRPRKLVTWPQAQAMSFDYVLASVSPHQRPFATLATKFGARLIHQVGNARHPIDPQIPQIVLASANVEARRYRRAQVVSYHQEFDREVFRYAEPTDPLAVTSFMLRLDWTSCDYQWMAGAKGIHWASVGGADPHDPHYLAPMSKVADRLRETGWVWHDKRIGDGYGHVIHTAAAMGRPLIGHASHYAGLTGEYLWRDLDTCIDLDRHSEKDALRLIGAIGADPEWYRDITERSRAAFEANVHFDVEAERILAVLA
jgi:hypothetical protein